MNQVASSRPITLAVFLVAATAHALATHAVSPPDRPNIVMIISDDQTYTDFGFMGNDRVQTPHLDELAAQSVRFTHGYVPASVCRPSLVTLLTGKYPHQHGVHFNHPPPGFAKLTKTPAIDKAQHDALREQGATLIRQNPSLPRLLADAGYRALQTGKYWEGHYRNAGFTDGMTIAQPSGGKNGDKELPSGEMVAHGNGDHGLAIGRETMQPIDDFLDNVGDQPFMIWYAPFLPHTPHDSPEKYFRMYRGQAGIAKHEVPYFAAITQFDDTVGHLLRAIETRGHTENTLFVFVVDNGWTPDPNRYLERSNEWDHTNESKRAPFDDGLRTPILFRWDGQTTPQTIERPVSSVEIVPSVLQAVGIDLAPLGLPTTGLWDEATGAASGDPMSPVFGEIYPGDATVLGDPARDVAYRWVRQGRYKLIVPEIRGGKPAWNQFVDQPVLYDVIADPKETKDLSADPTLTETAAKLRQTLDAWWQP